MRQAKIVATLGPSSNTAEQITNLIRAGLDVARVNMSHGTHQEHRQLIRNIREASKKAQKEVAILLDLQGPKIRVDKLEKPLELKKGEKWKIGTHESSKAAGIDLQFFIPTVYKDLVKDAHIGCSILFDDGLMEAKALAKTNDLLEVEIIEGGMLKSNKGINLPDVNVSAPSFTEKDRNDLMFGLAEDIDYLALSFVRTKEDILEVKYLLHSLKVVVPIVAKIERPEAIKNISDIISVADVIMIARGDMGVEVGNHLVPSIQKRIINLCNNHYVPVITATQMLESMISHPRPTRAEASDVANAIWDGTDAVMLSGETASGMFPETAINMMNKIIEQAELIPKERPLLRNVELDSIAAAQMVAASLIAEKINAKWIISITQSGRSCLKMGRFRSKAKVLGVASSIQVARKMCLYWGITPYLINDEDTDTGAIAHEVIEKMKKNSMIQNGDKLVITHGDGKYFDIDHSNTIRVEIVKDPPEKDNEEQFFQEADFKDGKILFDSSLCASCQNCIQICPHEIWKISDDENGATYLDQKRAPECALDMECVETCPVGAIEIMSKR